MLASAIALSESRFIGTSRSGLEEIRTLDLRYAKATLYQLSYEPPSALSAPKALTGGQISH